MIQFKGYAPDLPPETPGVFTDCDQIIPLSDGFRSQGSALDVGVDALSGPARGFAVAQKIDGTLRTFAATQTAIYELSGTTWTDRSDTGGYALGSDVENCARFAQFGDVTIAAVGHATALQASSSGAFAAISGAPKANIVETVNNFVLAFNFDTAANGWKCAALGGYTDWTPSVATQCVAGTLVETPGPIRAAKRLGSNIVAFKESSAYFGTYVGAPIVWSWSLLPGDVGCISQESIVNIGTALLFISRDDFQLFDGSRFTPIGSPLARTFFSDLSPVYRTRIKSAHDRENFIVYWYYPSRSGAGSIDKCLAYNYKTNQWGKCDVTVEAVAEFIQSGTTYESLGTDYSTYDDLPTDISFDSSFWTSSSASIGFFKSDHKIYTWGGTSADSSITLGHIGDVAQFSTLTKVRPRFLQTPTSSTLEHFYSNENADSMSVGVTTTIVNNVYDLIWSARWHKLKLNFYGPTKINGIQPELTEDGDE